MKKTAGECKAILKERYKKDPSVTVADIDAAIERHYPDEEKKKKARLNGDAGTDEQKSPPAKK